MRIREELSSRSIRGAVALVAVALLGLALVPTSAGADQLSDKRAEASAVADKLERMDARMMEINAQYERAVFELDQAQKQVADAKVLADRTQHELELRQADLRRYAIEAYQTGNDSPELDAILSSDADTGFRKRNYLESVSGNRRDYIDALNAAKVKVKEDTARLESAEKAASAHSAEIEKARSAQASAVAEQQAIANKVKGELASLVAQETARRTAAQQSSRGTRPNTPSGIGDNSGLDPNISLPAPPPGRGAAGAVAAALTRVGAPYVWGAAGPTSFDCSGLVVWAYAQVGISLPHYSGAQYLATTRISASQLQPGDLVFYGPGGSEHVGIYMGGNQLVQAAHGIAITNFSGWWKDPVGYGRVVG